MLAAAAILLVIYFFVAAVRITRAVGKEAAIFREFGQSKQFRVLVWFFPAGPIFLLAGSFLGFVVAFALSVVCYLPAMVAARKCIASFERAGTDRVKRAQNTATQAFGNAIAGLVFSAFILVINLGALVYAPTN